MLHDAGGGGAFFIDVVAVIFLAKRDVMHVVCVLVQEYDRELNTTAATGSRSRSFGGGRGGRKSHAPIFQGIRSLYTWPIFKSRED